MRFIIYEIECRFMINFDRNDSTYNVLYLYVQITHTHTHTHTHIYICTIILYNIS